MRTVFPLANRSSWCFLSVASFLLHKSQAKGGSDDIITTIFI